MRFTFDLSFARVPAGSEWETIDNTYMLEICDCCGKRRKCDYCKNPPGEIVSGTTFMDLCRSCRREHGREVE